MKRKEKSGRKREESKGLKGNDGGRGRGGKVEKEGIKSDKNKTKIRKKYFVCHDGQIEKQVNKKKKKERSCCSCECSWNDDSYDGIKGGGPKVVFLSCEQLFATKKEGGRERKNRGWNTKQVDGLLLDKGPFSCLELQFLLSVLLTALYRHFFILYSQRERGVDGMNIG